MVAETVSQPKKFSKRHGLKKVFSVPVGKLRNKIVTPGRNGSSSRSGSISLSKHKVLLRNNRDLARALSSEKERTRGVVTENVSLRARLHETRQKVHGLEKEICQSRESLTVYQNSIMNHLRDAVRHSVSLTESLKQAMGLCFTEPRDSQIRMNIVSDCNVPTTTSQPQRLRVNPMVNGHTIRCPTINLKRIVVSSENNIVEMNMAPSQQQVPETIEDEPQSLEETQERPGGLSTCFEEDEGADPNMNELSVEEEENEHNDSFRRKVVSFQNTLEKERNRSQLEGRESSSPDVAPQDMESSSSEQEQVKTCKIVSDSIQSQVTVKPSVPENCFRKNPVVALNDISKFLHNSNSVNVQKVILDIDHSKHSGKVGGVALEGSSSEKENCPKLVPMKKSVAKQFSVSSRIDSNLLRETNELSMEGSIDNFNDNENRNAVSSSAAVQAVIVPNIDQDPLEGTSWMHMYSFSEKEKRTGNGGCRTLSKEICPKSPESEKNKVDITKIVDTTKEKIRECKSKNPAINQLQEDSDTLIGNEKETSDEYDTGDFDIDLQNCPVAQSTPMNHAKIPQNGNVLCGSDVPISSSKSTKDINFSNCCVSPVDSNSQGNSQVYEKGEKNLAVPIGDTKLDDKAFVTVRVKRLNMKELSPTNSLVSSTAEVDDNANKMCDEVMEFLGFAANSDSEEKVLVNQNEIEARDIPGSCSAPGNLNSVLSDSETQIMGSYSEGDSCDVYTGESGRPKRRAAPKELKEPNLRKKLRQDTKRRK